MFDREAMIPNTGRLYLSPPVACRRGNCFEKVSGTFRCVDASWCHFGTFEKSADKVLCPSGKILGVFNSYLGISQLFFHLLFNVTNCCSSGTGSRHSHSMGSTTRRAAWRHQDVRQQSNHQAIDRRNSFSPGKDISQQAQPRVGRYIKTRLAPQVAVVYTRYRGCIKDQRNLVRKLNGDSSVAVGGGIWFF